mgnify:CR=1 FL=1
MAYGGLVTMHHSFVGPRALILAPVLFLLVIAMGCGGAAAEPIVVEKEVIKEVVKQIVVTPEPQSTAIPLVIAKGQTFNQEWKAKKHF